MNLDRDDHPTEADLAPDHYGGDAADYVVDGNGTPIRVGMRVSTEPDLPPGKVVEITDPDGDEDAEGRPVFLSPRVLVEWAEGDDPDAFSSFDDRQEERWQVDDLLVAPEPVIPGHPRWREFSERLVGPEGCDFREGDDGPTWKCGGGTDKSKATAILREMGGADVDASLAHYEDHGGYCDCEIIFNVGGND